MTKPGESIFFEGTLPWPRMQKTIFCITISARSTDDRVLSGVIRSIDDLLVEHVSLVGPKGSRLLSMTLGFDPVYDAARDPNGPLPIPDESTPPLVGRFGTWGAAQTGRTHVRIPAGLDSIVRVTVPPKVAAAQAAYTVYLAACKARIETDADGDEHYGCFEPDGVTLAREPRGLEKPITVILFAYRRAPETREEGK